MFTLGARSRAALGAAAFIAFAAAFASATVAATGVGGVPLVAAEPLATQSPATLAFVPVLRDPFAGGTPSTAHTAASAPAADAASSGIAPHVPFALPPNAGAPAEPQPFASGGVRVGAVVTGPQPFAVLDEGAGTRIVTVGDRVLDEAIAAIDARGVRLAGGRYLDVVPRSGPPGERRP